MRKKSITTKTGDSGTTGLFDNTRVVKYDPRPEVYGALDEACAFIGLARAQTGWSDLKTFLLDIQNHIYLINAELSCPTESLPQLKKRLRMEHLDVLEKKTDQIEARLELPPRFVIYGQSVLSAHLDIARSVVRRAERRLTELNAREPLHNSVLLAYVNRLSDTLFILARDAENRQGIPYLHPL
jgi:cob(I)alamin adenosyltransferase